MKENGRNGFTLIELLAVIVILAIIALIATPMILGVIESAKKQAFLDTGYGMVATAELYYSEQLLKQEEMKELHFYYANGKPVSEINQLKFKGENPKTGELTIDPDGKIELAIYNGTYCVTKAKNKTELKIEKKKAIDCVAVEASKVGVELLKNEVYRGSKEDIRGFLKVTGEDGADLTNQVTIEVVSDTYNNDVEGTYEVKFVVTDLEGLVKIASETINVIPLVFSYDYTGNSQTFTVPYDGVYQVELWGAGGIGGAYVKGNLPLSKEEELYVYVGQKPVGCRPYNACGGAFNGGGAGGYFTQSDYMIRNPSGAGATDMRLKNGTWDNVDGLKSRIMVAGGSSVTGGGYAGTLTGHAGNNASATPGGGGTQTSGGTSAKYQGSFGKGGQGYISSPSIASCNDGYGGGGGYYGGGGGTGGVPGCSSDHRGYGGGGSSFVSGCTGCNAIDSNGTPTGQPNHFSNKVFEEIVMKAGNEEMPDPRNGGVMTGNVTQDGYARITLVRSLPDQNS